MIKNNLKEILEQKNISREEVAYKTGLSCQTINNLIYNKSFRLITLEKVAKFLNVSVKDLIKEE